MLPKKSLVFFFSFYKRLKFVLFKNSKSVLKYKKGYKKCNINCSIVFAFIRWQVNSLIDKK